MISSFIDLMGGEVPETFISDQERGIIAALKDLYEAHSIVHLYDQFHVLKSSGIKK
jgi:hypothetical protein